MRRHSIFLVALLWTLFCGSNTWRGIDGTYKTLNACIAEGKKQVDRSNARRTKFEALAAATKKAHPGVGVGNDEDYNVGWECVPSDGSPSTYGGYWLIKKP